MFLSLLDEKQEEEEPLGEKDEGRKRDDGVGVVKSSKWHIFRHHSMRRNKAGGGGGGGEEITLTISCVFFYP